MMMMTATTTVDSKIKVMEKKTHSRHKNEIRKRNMGHEGSMTWQKLCPTTRIQQQVKD
jgi:hypothetical protein